jgi:hypothetical protein
MQMPKAFQKLILASIYEEQSEDDNALYEIEEDYDQSLVAKMCNLG